MDSARHEETTGTAATTARAQAAAQEQAAIAVVHSMLKAAETLDIAGIMALVADDIEFKGIPDVPFVKGREAMLAQLQRIGSLPIFERTITAKEVGRMVAFGGETGATVSFYREDYLKEADGSLRTVPIVASLLVQNGKIKLWYDLPLIPDPDGTNWGA